MRMTVTALALAALAVAIPAAAKDKKPVAPPAVYQAVVDCRGIAEAAQRLACFDRTVGEMAKAGEDKNLVVLDREAMRETRKGLFGFNLPKLKLFGGGDDNDDGEQEVTEIESTIAGIRTADDGMPVFTIADGARWKQTEGRNVFPKIGDPIRIKKATLGSYMANVNKRAAVRVMRLN
jgi:hypothetical protein